MTINNKKKHAQYCIFCLLCLRVRICELDNQELYLFSLNDFHTNLPSLVIAFPLVGDDIDAAFFVYFSYRKSVAKPKQLQEIFKEVYVYKFKKRG